MYLPKLNVGYAGKAGAIGYNVGVVGTSFKNAGDKQITAVLGYITGSACFWCDLPSVQRQCFTKCR